MGVAWFAGRPASRIGLRAPLLGLAVAIGCTSGSPGPSSVQSPPPAGSPVGTASLAILGRVVTLDEPATAEALFIEDGSVTAVGTRDEILALAGDGVAVMDIGAGVAYPGFIDAHAHWIGDREHYGLATPGEAIDAALSRGWTSISEQWVNRDRLAELEALAAADALPLRVDAYLTLNEPAPGSEHFGDWYADRTPGPVTSHLRVQGIKMHLDNGWGTIFHWEPADLTATVGRADAAGWQVSIHTVSTEAHDMVLDAFEAAIGPTGPNPRHHRIDHAIQVTDEQLERMVAMDLVTVVHLDGAAADWVLEEDYLGHFGPDNPGEEVGWLARWRDFVDARLHVAAATDAPWIFPGFALTDDIGRPLDQIAGGMDGRGRANPETPPWVLDQLLTAEQGLRAVTRDAAYALGDEARRGHLAPGTVGDVTILSGDVTAATPDEIREMRVLATIVGGAPAYCGDPAIGCQPAG
ncbi:MAG TPA: amidohydrolase family protein [Candidatus Limnocylindrales bacterium]|nr:amidohydrolase family protein [Candidatus Limnocylindrales bacterium]